MGGGGFTMPENDHSDALDRFVLELTGKDVPRVCFLPTASGDPRDQVTRFHERFGDWPCEPIDLSLFHLGRDRVDPIDQILSQDALYIGGGSMRNMLAIWREHGIDDAMRRAWERGVVLAGLSAGAMCWFEGGVSMSGGRPEVVPGSGCCRDLCPCTSTANPSGCRSTRRRSPRGRCPQGLRPTTALPSSTAARGWPSASAHGVTREWCVSSPTVAAGRSPRPRR